MRRTNPAVERVPRAAYQSADGPTMLPTTDLIPRDDDDDDELLDAWLASLSATSFERILNLLAVESAGEDTAAEHSALA